MEDYEISFNPCFNGTYSLTFELKSTQYDYIYCFNPCFNGTYSLTHYPYTSPDLVIEF